jgi:hypothetical protein
MAIPRHLASMGRRWLKKKAPTTFMRTTSRDVTFGSNFEHARLPPTESYPISENRRRETQKLANFGRFTLAGEPPSGWICDVLRGAVGRIAGRAHG